MGRDRVLSLPISLLLSGLLATTRAQDVCYPGLASATITVCVPYTGHPEPTPCAGDGPKPWIKGPGHDGGIVTVNVPMPSCVACGCPTCVWTDSYTKTFEEFCPTGLVNKPYVIQELYTGLPMKPSITGRPEVPHGFTTEVQTCTTCGAKPVVATITFPDAKYPWATDLSGPVPAPSGAPAWVVKPEGSEKGYMPAPVAPMVKGVDAGLSSPAWVPFVGPAPPAPGENKNYGAIPPVGNSAPVAPPPVGNSAPVAPPPVGNKYGGAPPAMGNNASMNSLPMDNKNGGGAPPAGGSSPVGGGGAASPDKPAGSDQKPVVAAAASVPNFIMGLATASALLFAVVVFLV